MKTLMRAFNLVIILFLMNCIDFGVIKGYVVRWKSGIPAIVFEGHARSLSCANLKSNNGTLIPQDKLQEDLLCDYDTYKRPVKDPNKIVYVNVRFRPIFFDIMKQEEIIRVSGILEFSWTDEFLKWSPNKYGSLSEMKSSYYDIWYPKISSFDLGTAYRFIDEMDRLRFDDAIIKFNGTIILRATVTLFGPCKYDSKRWPFEEWSCTFTLARTSDDSNMVQTAPFKSSNIDLSGLEQNNAWQIVSNPPFGLTDYPPMNPQLELGVTLQRHVSHYQTIFVVPGIALLLLSLFSFWLTSRIYCRILINILTTLVQLSFLERMFSLLDGNGSKGVVIYQFYSDIMLVSFLGLMLAVLNAKLLPRTTDPPNYITEVIEIIALIPYIGPVFSYFINDDIDGLSKVDDDEVGLVATADEKGSQKWRIISNFCDKCIFLLIVLYFVAFYLLRVLI